MKRVGYFHWQTVWLVPYLLLEPAITRAVVEVRGVMRGQRHVRH